MAPSCIKAPQILKLLQGQGIYHVQEELLILVDELPKHLSVNSIKVIALFNNSHSNQHNCEIKEIINNCLIIVMKPNISNFEIMIVLMENDQILKSNIAKCMDAYENFAYTTFRDINIGIIHLKKIDERYRGNQEAEAEAIESLNQCYISVNEKGNTIFHDALTSHHFKEIADIVKRHLNLVYDAKNYFGEGVLHYACRTNKYAYVEALMELGCSLAQQDRSKSTPLHLAIEYEAQETISVFVDILNKEQQNLKASIGNGLKVYNLKGQTALHTAILNNEENLVVAIIKYCKTNNKLDICRMEMLGGGARILHLAKSKNLDKLWHVIAQEMPEAVHLTDYSGRTSTAVALPRAPRKHQQQTVRRFKPYVMKVELPAENTFEQKYSNRNLENKLSSLQIKQ